MTDFIEAYGDIPESDITEINGTDTDDVIRIPIMDRALTVYGNTGDDNIRGYGLNDNTIYAGDGNDTIETSGVGNSIIYGGRGNDYISCAFEDDDSSAHYELIFNNGDGKDSVNTSSNDTVLKFTGTNISDIHLEKLGNNLVIKYNSDRDSVDIRYVYEDNNQEYDNDITSKYTIEDMNGTQTSLTDFITAYGDIPEASEGYWIIGTETDDRIRIPDITSPDTVYNAGLDKKYIIADAEGNDILNIRANDINISDVTILFNINEDGTEFGDISILENTNIDKWENSEDFEEIVIKDNSIETINYNDDKTITSADIEQLAQDVATWLNQNDYTNVQEVLNGGNEADIDSLIAVFQGANWQQM